VLCHSGRMTAVLCHSGRKIALLCHSGQCTAAVWCHSGHRIDVLYHSGHMIVAWLIVELTIVGLSNSGLMIAGYCCFGLLFVVETYSGWTLVVPNFGLMNALEWMSAGLKTAGKRSLQWMIAQLRTDDSLLVG